MDIDRAALDGLPGALVLGEMPMVLCHANEQAQEGLTPPPGELATGKGGALRARGAFPLNWRTHKLS